MQKIRLSIKNRLVRVILGELLIAVFFFLFVFVVNLIPTKLVVSLNSNSETVFKKLSEVNTSYESSFTAGANLLNRVDVLFKNPNLESRDELDLLLIDDNGEVISLQKFSGFNLGDTTQARMDFGSQPDSKNRIYKILIRPTKIVDGKLTFGTRDGRIEFMEYYSFETSAGGALKSIVSVAVKLVRYQLVVLLLPIFFAVALLW